MPASPRLHPRTARRSRATPAGARKRSSTRCSPVAGASPRPNSCCTCSPMAKRRGWASRSPARSIECGRPATGSTRAPRRLPPPARGPQSCRLRGGGTRCRGPRRQCRPARRRAALLRAAALSIAASAGTIPAASPVPGSRRAPGQPDNLPRYPDPHVSAPRLAGGGGPVVDGGQGNNERRWRQRHRPRPCQRPATCPRRRRCRPPGGRIPRRAAPLRLPQRRARPAAGWHSGRARRAVVLSPDPRDRQPAGRLFDNDAAQAFSASRAGAGRTGGRSCCSRKAG